MRTNVTESSIKSYDQLKAHGMGESHAKILAIMVPGRTYTRKEIARLIDMDTSSVSGRVFELIELNEIEVCGSKKCPHSNKTVEAIRLKPKLVNQQANLFN